jgi:hypothetical protein
MHSSKQHPDFSSASYRLTGFAPRGTFLQREQAGSPEPYAVWLDGDILGAGRTPNAAVDAARDTIVGWAK